MTKRLYRSRKERMVAGVCGGLAEYFDVDPTIIRLLVVALSILAGGSGVVIYIVMAIVVPEEPVGAYKTQELAPTPPVVDVKAEEVDAEAGEEPPSAA